MPLVSFLLALYLILILLSPSEILSFRHFRRKKLKTMPTTHGAGSPNQQLYSLFPKKKKGSKKNEELEEGVSI